MHLWHFHRQFQIFLYMALVADDSQKNFRRIAFRGLLIAFVICNCFYLFREISFSKYLDYNCFFQIAGGILVAVIGYHELIVSIHPAIKMEQQAVNSDPMSIAILLLQCHFLRDQVQYNCFKSDWRFAESALTMVVFLLYYVSSLISRRYQNKLQASWEKTDEEL